MGARRTARERALQALYQVEMSGAAVTDALDSAWAAEAEEEAPDAESRAFALKLVSGVREHLGELDSLIQEHSHNWRLDRMARIDRNVLRLAAFELEHCEDIPRKVTLNEAIELGKR